ncbi:MAG: ferritin-like domain-containing protein [Solirubrobacterales bacterium]|nr:ferritin-like domain-containing protein [Solirubrobacterales bacterium]
MSINLNLNDLDVDGAIRESAEDAGLDRSDFIRKGVLAGGGLLAGTALFAQYVDPAAAAISTRRKSAANDVKILNFALTLEFLEAEFYREARVNNAYLNPSYERFGVVVARHEARHVSFLRGALGSKAIRKPRFDFKDTVTDPNKFAATSQVLEDTGVMAYLGQVANVRQDSVLAAAGTIATVEARHAAWIRFLNGGGAPDAVNSKLPAPSTFDLRRSERTILKAVGDTGFIQ